jgi:hypothetical protein
MTTPTITWQSIDRIADRLLGSDVTGKNYYGDQPCLPADALLAVCGKLSSVQQWRPDVSRALAPPQRDPEQGASLWPGAKRAA